MKSPASSPRLLGALLLALVLAAPAKAQSIDAAFFALLTALGQVEERATRQQGFLSVDRIASLRARVARLQDAAASLESSDAAPYAASLMAQAELLSASAGIDDPEEARLHFTEVEEDLRIKDESRRSLGLGGGLLGHVRVGVYTVRQNQRVGGLAVGASPVALRRPDPLFRFPRLSDASQVTLHDLPPGRYAFTVEQNGRRLSAGRQEIGLQGQESMTVDLVVSEGGQ